MLKSFTLKPTCDILSYIDHIEYPFKLFPTLLLVYNKKVIKLDDKELSLLYHICNNDHDIKSNEFKINIHGIKNPKVLFLEKNNNCTDMINNKFRKIKKLLPFCDDICNMIIKLMQNENLKWEIKTDVINRHDPLILDKYNITDETSVSFKNIMSKYHKKDVYVDKICYGIFNNSCIPSKINITYFKSGVKKKVNINNNYITKILVFLKKKQKYNKYLDNESSYTSEDEYNTEDNLVYYSNA